MRMIMEHEKELFRPREIPQRAAGLCILYVLETFHDLMRQALADIDGPKGWR